MEQKQGLIFSLITKIMAKVGSISKTRKNAQQGYMFRGIDDVYLALQGVLAEHGVFFSPEVIASQREEKPSKSGGVLFYTILTIKYTFYASDGSSFVSVVVGEAMDSGDKSTNKAMSAALKYALLQIFCIPTEEDKDTENHSPDPAPSKGLVATPIKSAAIKTDPVNSQANLLKSAMLKHKWGNADISDFIMKRFGAESFSKLDDASRKELIHTVETLSYPQAVQGLVMFSGDSKL